MILMGVVGLRNGRFGADTKSHPTWYMCSPFAFITCFYIKKYYLPNGQSNIPHAGEDKV